MKTARRKQLERAGFAVGSARDFLQLAPEESALIEMRLSLSRALRERRTEAGITQTELARMTQSSQSRVAKMEAGDASVSLDLLIRALLSLGVSPREVGKVLGSRVA